ncbi:hypothetical protein B9Q08_01555 [Candidatus Marsarchaeota G2 archaeon ECH_B_SAG-M15]|uniref:DEAD/DEAH box helicase n=1 Tax=Candidatus Marsarchaeota G2 archaeon ECH_B_SAG-M15 TaxID=1978162 RepID=A0A2R6B0X6_9ARCH|nr:MAG: hypothetical protein B9Q08_01555 [Candidatus Marsarchaeota G2 archaeon ECH_B_SAG-M15]
MIELKSRLKHTWDVFFSRHGSLNEVQKRVIPLVLEGKSVVVCAPTASGKTEAVFAPIAETLYDERHIERLGVLYIAPTRALVNDMYERIRIPLSSLSYKVGIRTGDKKAGESTSHFLLTTPESLDSAICRLNSSFFEELKFVVLDELHLLDCTYRGDQLRILLKRLEGKLKSGKVCYAILSATLNDPWKTASKYISDFEVVTIHGKPKEVFYEILVAKLEDGLKQISNTFVEKGIFKALFFCNSRKRTEEVAQQLKRFLPADSIGVHHSSLSKKERGEVEKAMRDLRRFYCVSTSSLEVGIDIGSIDAVVLIDPPPTVSSLIQRIGRGNRRTNKVLAFGLCEHQEEEPLFREMFELAKRGVLEKKDCSPDLSVGIQQIFSLLFEKKRCVEDHEILSLLAILGCDLQSFRTIMNHLCSLGYVESCGGFGFRASEKLMNMGIRGVIHSNIPDSDEFEVVDASSSKTIGKVVVDPYVVDSFVLAGKTWRVLKIDVNKRSLIVKEESVFSTADEKIFVKRSSLGRFSSLLPVVS